MKFGKTCTALMAALVVLGGAGCKQKKTVKKELPAATASGEALRERVLVSQVGIEIVDPENGPKLPLVPRELGRALGHQLAQSGFFAAMPEDVPEGHRVRPAIVGVRIHYFFIDVGEGKVVAKVTVESQVAWDDRSEPDRAPGANVLGEQLLETEDELVRKNEILTELVSTILAEAGHDLIAREQARLGGDEGIVQALASDDPEQVRWALLLIGERKAVRFLDAVLEKLAGENEYIRNHAVTALVALGDRRAVDALAKQAAFDDHEFMRMSIEAVTVLGGDDAREYLEFIASGHPDGEIRAHALDGLERLAGRAKE